MPRLSQHERRIFLDVRAACYRGLSSEELRLCVTKHLGSYLRADAVCANELDPDAGCIYPLAEVVTMPSLALSIPALPGGSERIRAVAQEVDGARRAEFEDFHRRMKVRRENWYLQQTPQGDLIILYLELDDPVLTFGALAQSNHPFDTWFKEQAKTVHGIDFNQPPTGPMAEVLLESS